VCSLCRLANLIVETLTAVATAWGGWDRVERAIYSDLLEVWRFFLVAVKDSISFAFVRRGFGELVSGRANCFVAEKVVERLVFSSGVQLKVFLRRLSKSFLVSSVFVPYRLFLHLSWF